MTDNAPHTTDQSKEATQPPPLKCEPLKCAPTAPNFPVEKECPLPDCCPKPAGDTPKDCLDMLIRSQAKCVKKAERAKEFVEELTAIQGKLTSAQANYTLARYNDLLKLWQDQDKRIHDLVHKLECSVLCWECLLECRLCPELRTIRALNDRLNGTGDLTENVFSLIDLQFWHQRNVFQMQARVNRIKLVLTAWEKPFETLGEVLDKNGKLIDDTQNIIATDSAKAVYDVFMTLLPRHWAIRPRTGDGSKIDLKYIEICKCDDGVPDDCCGPDVGILSLRDRLVGPLPYIVDPVKLADIICCLTSERLSPASEQLAAAQAEHANITTEIDQDRILITTKTAAIEATFLAELGKPIDCDRYTKNDAHPPAQTTPTTPIGSYQGNVESTDQTAS